MDNDRTRPFILEPVYHGAPASWSEKYFQGKLKEYRQNHPEFDEYLIDIEAILRQRKILYYANILKFLNGEAKTNWVSPANSLLRTFIKFFNYDFSAKQTVDYINKCHQAYVQLLNNDLTISKEYEIVSKRCRWDGNTRDYINLSLSPVKYPENPDDYYWVDISFCSLQEMNCDPDCFGDNEIILRSGRNIYKDALYLFDYHQGSKFLHKCLELVISELLKNDLISRPVKMEYTHFNTLFYSIRRPHSYKINEK